MRLISFITFFLISTAALSQNAVQKFFKYSTVYTSAFANSPMQPTTDYFVTQAGDLRDVTIENPFDYTATISSSRFINSTKSLTQYDDGVLFTSQLNGPSLLEFYTFQGVLPDIDNFTLILRMAKDWENASVYNPFGTLVTSYCEITPGRIIIEAEGVSMQVAKEALRLAAQKLPIPTKFVVRHDYVEN